MSSRRRGAYKVLRVLRKNHVLHIGVERERCYGANHTINYEERKGPSNGLVAIQRFWTAQETTSILKKIFGIFWWMKVVRYHKKWNLETDVTWTETFWFFFLTILKLDGISNIVMISFKGIQNIPVYMILQSIGSVA